MPKKKLPQTIEECNAELERTQKQLQQYENRNKMRQLPQQYGKLLLYAKRNFFEYFFHLYNNFFFKHKLPPFIPYRCFSSIYPLFCSPIQSASWDGAFHPASPEYPSCIPAAAAPQYDLL